jgi:hypothetical protein
VPAGNTYEAIATTTLGSATASVTYSSLGAYTDIVIIFNGVADNNLSLRFNGDTGSNYSVTRIQGDSSSATSTRFAPITSMYGPYAVSQQISIWQVMNYSNSTTNKTALARGGGAGTATEAYVGLWRNTAAITSISVLSQSGNMATGSTISLYGIKAA